MAIKKARVLTRTYIEGVPYECDDVVALDDKLAKTLADVVDTSTAAVEYAEKVLGKSAKPHGKAA